MGVAVAACTADSETKTALEPTAEPTTIHQAPTLTPDSTPAESPTAVPILKPTKHRFRLLCRRRTRRVPRSHS